MTEAEKTVQGLVPIQMESGEHFIKFNNRANQMIYEKTGKRMVEYFKDLYNSATKQLEKKKTDAGMIELLEKVVSPEELSFLLFCGLLHEKKYKSIEELEDDMIVSQEFVYMGVLIIAMGKLITDYITAKPSTK